MKAKIEYVVSRINQNVSRKKEIEERYQRDIEEINYEISKDKLLLEKLNEVLVEYICPSCQGSGNESFTDAAGSRDYKDCDKCKATGFKI